jgi:two-component system CheB/CheR fusion protein
VQTLALALHELATNALKHGALNAERGRLDVSWTFETEGRAAPSAVLLWRESGLDKPPDTSKVGFGRKLIGQALKFTLRATTDMTFGPDGVSCRIELPLRQRPRQEPSQAAGKEGSHETVRAT